MMKKVGLKKRIAIATLAFAVAFTTVMARPQSASAKISGYTDALDGDVVKVVKEKNYSLVPGVTETDIVLNDQTGDNQVMAYMTTIEQNADVSLKATYSGYYDPKNYDKETKESKWQVGDWSLTTTTHQAQDYEKSTGEKIIFATNGDYFNMQTGQPRGSLYINGKCLNPEKDKEEPFFAVLKDGSYVLREAGSDKSDVLEAVSGPFFMIKNGVKTPGLGSELFPVNSVGMKEDGTVVFFMADGRQYPRSVGMTISEQADFLLAQGVVNAIYMDGGGSATVVTRREGEKTYSIRNNPSDGSERNISSGFLLVANSISDGEFDHAVISANGDLFTPGSNVIFTAKGVDSAGGEANLPESGLKWALDKKSDKKGDIDENTGVFTSNGKTGDVTAELYYEDKKVAEYTVKIAEPDELYFNSASATLDFGERSNLDLIVRSENADIVYKDGDFEWTIEPLNPEDEGNDLGHMEGNTFVAGTASTSMHAKITVNYARKDGKNLSASIVAEIGKMPVVAFNFEPNDNGPLKGAHFHWGKSNYVDAGVTPGYYGDYDELTVPVANTYSINETRYATLKAPFRFTGNYDTTVPAAEIFHENGYAFYLWPNNSITHFCAGSVTTTSQENGGQVRFGDYAMELNYDYASYDGSSNSNYYIRNCAGAYEVEGQPTELGVWVYADAKTYNLAGYSLHADIAVFGGTSYSTKNLSLVHDDVDENGNLVKNSAINWVGWKYCYADLTGLASYYSPEHPYMIRNGEGLVWLSFQPAAGGGRYSGTFYFDNYRFVYGTNLDDLDNPYFKTLTVNDQSIYKKEDVVVDTNSVEITATFADATGKNATGIDATRTSFRIDGNEISCDGDENTATTRLELANGLHSVDVTVYDKFGNNSSITSYVTVGEPSTTEIATLAGADTVVLGSDYELSLNTQGSISSVDMTVLQLNSDFGEPVVTAADGWDVEAVYSSTGFKKAKMEIKANWVGEGAAPADAKVASLAFNVPTSLDPEIDFFTYQVTKVTCVTVDGRTVTSAQQKVTIGLSAYYTVNAAVAVSGFDTLLTVVNPSNEPEEGVEVFVNGSSIGHTDANGEITTSVTRDIAAGGSFKVMAKKGDLISFETTISVMKSSANSEGKPEGLMNTASKNGSSEQTITWFASSAATENAAVVEYSLNSDLSDATTVSGESTLQAFATSKDAAYINTVKLSGLESGRTYYYRAGDGNNWSDVTTFKTIAENEPVSFFVVGDTQMHGNRNTDAEEIELLKNLGVQVAGSDFGIQTGDYVDNGGNYNMWEEMDATFNEAFDGADVIHTMGNHEYYGDADGVAARAIFGHTDAEKDYYSVEYGNVYVAVINYSASLKEACEWLIEDANASSAQWKFLSVHQPAYYTNVNGGSQRFHASIPAAAEAAGIDAVFSGHDHSYARTLPMVGGQINEEDGVVYFICGDLGEKSRNINYAATNDPNFNFACVDQSYDAVTIKVTAGADDLTFTTVDSQGNIIDTYKKESPCAEGHTWETYDRATGLMSCSKCGATADAREELYSGWLNDSETGKKVYLASGKLTKGFIRIENKAYLFDDKGLLNYDGFYVASYSHIYYAENGCCLSGLQYINDKYYYFDPNSQTLVEGKVLVTVDNSNGLLDEDTEMDFVKTVEIKNDSKGVLRCYIEGERICAGFIEVDGDYYYIVNGGRVSIGQTYVSITNNMVNKGYYFFGEDGKLDLTTIKEGIIEEDGHLYYYHLDRKVYAGLIEIDGSYYYVNTSGTVVTGRYYVRKTNGLMPSDYYQFGQDGKMILHETKNGIVEEDGVMYYYVNDKKTYAGLIKIDDSYYYVNGKCVVVTGKYFVSRTNGLMPQGYYEFDEKGRMIIPEVKNGIVEENGVMYYYVNDKKTYAGLIKIDDSYYYVNSRCVVVTGKYCVSKTNGLMPQGYYEFDEEGRMIIPEVKNGIVEENGVMYYYVNDVKTYAGLIMIDDSYYYVNGRCVVVTGKYFVSRTNGLMPQGYYEFDEKGRMIIDSTDDQENEVITDNDESATDNDPEIVIDDEEEIDEGNVDNTEQDELKTDEGIEDCDEEVVIVEN